MNRTIAWAMLAIGATATGCELLYAPDTGKIHDTAGGHERDAGAMMETGTRRDSASLPDVGNVAEASAGFSFGELRDDGSYYCSVTIPSLIVATVGGGTGLPTQRECLETLGCYGPGRVRAFAEIVAATVLCGELSLGSAIAADEWVSSHEAHGRNRPADSPQPIP